MNKEPPRGEGLDAPHSQDTAKTGGDIFAIKHVFSTPMTQGAGGGGSPVHLIRDLSLKNCDLNLTKFQTWATRLK